MKTHFLAKKMQSGGAATLCLHLLRQDEERLAIAAGSEAPAYYRGAQCVVLCGRASRPRSVAVRQRWSFFQGLCSSDALGCVFLSLLIPVRIVMRLCSSRIPYCLLLFSNNSLWARLITYQRGSTYLPLVSCRGNTFGSHSASSQSDRDRQGAKFS